MTFSTFALKPHKLLGDTTLCKNIHNLTILWKEPTLLHFFLNGVTDSFIRQLVPPLEAAVNRHLLSSLFATDK